MATGRILVNVEQVEAAKSDYMAAKQTESDAISAIESAVRTLDGYWNGPANEAYMQNFLNLRATMTQSQSAMEDAINDLNTLITTTTEVENQETNAANSLPTGTNFF